jgi:hypothetical protein
MKFRAFRCDGPLLFAVGELLAQCRAARPRSLLSTCFARVGGGLPAPAAYSPHVPRGSLVDIRRHQVPVPRDLLP